MSYTGWDFCVDEWACGIDPGSIHFGIAAVTSEQFLYGEVWKEKHQPAAVLGERLYALCSTHRPALIGYERYVWMGAELTTGNSPALWQVIGAVQLVARLLDIPLYGFRPEELKRKITGQHRSDKAGVCWAIEKRLGCKITQGHGHHISDAAAAGLLACDEHAWRGRVQKSMEERYA